MNATSILDSQIIHVKKGRFNVFGFEPAWNAYFDFYLNSKYFGEALLQLEDVTFHLFLRKNLNDHNPNWKMPSIRQMMKRFGIGQKHLYAILERLEKAHLLTKDSGVGDGRVQRNDYILSDPIATLEEFLEVADKGLFRLPLLPEYQLTASEPSNDMVTPEASPQPEQCIQNEYINETSVSEMNTLSVSETNTPKHTSSKQTSGDATWDKALEDLRTTTPERTFTTFLLGTQLVSRSDGIATIGIPQPFAKDFIENRLSGKIARLLGVEAVRCVVLET